MTSDIRYQRNESPPFPLAFRLALEQFAPHLLALLVVVAIVVRAAGQSDAYYAWAAFGALVVSAVTVTIQSRPVWRFGAGYLLVAGTSGSFLAVCVTALTTGGPGLLGTLVLVSSAFHFAIAARLSLLQRIMTPAVRGTIRMLIVVSAMPILFDLLANAPAGAAPRVAPAIAATTVVVTVVLYFGTRGMLQLLSPGIGIVAGCIVAIPSGMYDAGLVAAAPWIGLPAGNWPGLDLEFGPEFWGLLPAFLIVAIINAMRTMSYATETQQASRRRSRATDHRSVQGAVAADGLGNALAGLLAVTPATTHGYSASMIRITGVASRRVGICLGILFLGVAILPKVAAIILAIPGPAIAAATAIMFVLFFVEGMRLVSQEELSPRKMLLVGLSFWIGVGFQSGSIFPGDYSPWIAALLDNAMTAGGLTVIALTLLTDRIGRRRVRLETVLSVEELPRIQRFLDSFGRRQGWGAKAGDRLTLAAQETLLTLLPEYALEEEEGASAERRLRLIAQRGGGGAELEFLATGVDANIEDRMALLSATENAPPEREFSLRLLEHGATCVRHQQYHDTDIVTVRVEFEGVSSLSESAAG